MRAATMQDWITINGPSGSTSATQSDSDYLDLAPFQDATLWIDIREATAGGGAFNLNFEHAPIREEIFFSAQGGLFATVVACNVGVSFTPIIFDNLRVSQQPIARWMRWRLTNNGASSAWSVTFRVLVAAHSLSI